MAAYVLDFPTSFTPITNNATSPFRTILPCKPSSLPVSSPKPLPSLCYRRPDYIPNHISDRSYDRIFDITLRDDVQYPGATMNTKEKLDIARQLAKLGVDIIEAGFPASSEADFEAVKLIAQEVGNVAGEDGHVPVICGLARCNKNDIDRAWEAVKYAKFPRIHTFIATSEIHMKYKLKMSKEQVVEKAISMVAYARSLGCDDVEFSPEDAGRSEREFLYEILGEVIKAGATTLNIPDTYNWPHEFGYLIADIISNTPGIENVIISTHCQNDLGLSTANTLEGAYNGARQLEVTINGIGERAGNASLEEVEEYSGLQVQPHKAILKNKITYEIMSPEDIGLFRSNESGLTLGKLSGCHALISKLLELGYDIDGRELNDLFWRFKSVAEMRKVIPDDDPIALVSDEVFQPKVWNFGNVQVTCGTYGLSAATIKLTDIDGTEHIACSIGTGPVDAAYQARVKLLEYSMSAVTSGIDAIASTCVLIAAENEIDAVTSGIDAIASTRVLIAAENEIDAVTSGIDAIASTRVLIAAENDHTTTHASGEKIARTYSVRAFVGAINKMLGLKKQSN